jgi:hypothetical protein
VVVTPIVGPLSAGNVPQPIKCQGKKFAKCELAHRSCANWVLEYKKIRAPM